MTPNLNSINWKYFKDQKAIIASCSGSYIWKMAAEIHNTKIVHCWIQNSVNVTNSGMWNTNELWWQLSPKLPIFFPLSCPYLVLYFPQSWFNPSTFVFSEVCTTLEHPLKDFTPQYFSVPRNFALTAFLPTHPIKGCILEPLPLTSESEFPSLFSLQSSETRYCSLFLHFSQVFKVPCHSSSSARQISSPCYFD